MAKTQPHIGRQTTRALCFSLLLFALISSSCGGHEQRSEQQRWMPVSGIGTTVEEFVQRAEEQGVVDSDTWRFMMLCLGDDRIIIRSLGVLILSGLSRIGLIEREIALAILEPVVIGGGEFARTWFRHYARIMGIEVSDVLAADLRQLQDNMGSRLSIDAIRLLDRAFANPDSSVGRSCAPFLIIAGIRFEDDRHIVLKYLEDQVQASSGDAERFWAVARAAVKGGYGSELPGPHRDWWPEISTSSHHRGRFLP